ncbi:MAG: hypothetical protein J6W96_06035 [Alphaproteobacteria bacterium]|nr:hypothetical protein [Alphaproteobacteria bacterium]
MANLKKRLSMTAIITTGLTIGNPQPSVSPENTGNSKAPTVTKTTASKRPASSATPPQKRKPQQVYHKFTEIPEIPDADAYLYTPKEYTYVMDGDAWQKHGQVKLKRVLTAETPQLSLLTPIYCRECKERSPKAGEDSKVTYDLDLCLRSSSGTFYGPTQMNRDAIKKFLKYLLANPKTRPYVNKYFKSLAKNKNVAELAQELHDAFYNEDGSLKTFEECKGINNNSCYINLALTEDAAKIYLSLAKEIPEDVFLTALETYQLRYFGIARTNGPITVVKACAQSCGYNNVTRLPPYVIGAIYCHINWKGNGTFVLKAVAGKPLPTVAKAKSWVDGKGPKGVQALAEQTILTPKLIEEYQMMGVPGAQELKEKYDQAVKQAEATAKTPKRSAQHKTIKSDTFLAMAAKLHNGHI